MHTLLSKELPELKLKDLLPNREKNFIDREK